MKHSKVADYNFQNARNVVIHQLTLWRIETTREIHLSVEVLE